jgi:pimeloyl-ACP methyl ester carboxylesterase
MMEEHSFDTSTVRLNYAEGPNAGPPLVLLHGGSARWQAALPLIPDLAADWHVYAPDLRGHGISGWVPGQYTMEDYAADVAAFLAGGVRAPAVLFGHSLGGQVAIMVAARHPALVRALILADPPFDRALLRAHIETNRPMTKRWRDLAGPSRSVEEIVAALQQSPVVAPGATVARPAVAVFGADHPWFPWMAENLHHQDPTMLDAVLEFDAMHAAFDTERLFPQITCPVLILQADPQAGGALSDGEVARALALLPQATHVQLTGVSHILHNERKEPVLAAMRPFLAAL